MFIYATSNQELKNQNLMFQTVEQKEIWRQAKCQAQVQVQT